MECIAEERFDLVHGGNVAQSRTEHFRLLHFDGQVVETRIYDISFQRC